MVYEKSLLLPEKLELTVPQVYNKPGGDGPGSLPTVMDKVEVST